MSLPRSRILRARAHFASVRSGGQSRPGRYLLVGVLALENAEIPSQFGIVTPKYVGKAHERNLLRRRLRALVAGDLPRLRSGHHVVIVARRVAASADFGELRKEWQRLATRAGLFRQPEDGAC